MPTIRLHLSDDEDDVAETVEFTDAEFEILRSEGVLSRDGDNFRTTPDDEWWVDEDRQPDEDDGRLTLDDIRSLAATLIALPGGQGDLTDSQALDLINYCLSASDWSVSFLEDIAAIVARTPRSPVLGAYWAKH